MDQNTPEPIDEYYDGAPYIPGESWGGYTYLGPDYANTAIPNDLRALIDRWKTAAAREKDTFTAEWFEKNAGQFFVWNHVRYLIDEKTLNITMEHFGVFSAQVIEKDLSALGINSIYTGDLD